MATRISSTSTNRLPILTARRGRSDHTQAVPNLTRITVQGSTNSPAEWLKLTIDGRKPYPFSWQNKVYCQNPSSEECKP